MGEEEEVTLFSPVIRVVGVGGAGCNVIDSLYRCNIQGVELIAMNTDKRQLDRVHAHKKILLGKDVTRGLGAGGDPKIGREAAQASIQEIKNALKGTDLLFLIAGMGGGTGTGASPIVAQVAKEMGALVYAFAILPFKEQRANLLKAEKGINELREICNVALIDNNRLAALTGDMDILEAFEFANKQIADIISSIVDVLLNPSYINVDFADFKNILSLGDISVIGVGQSDSENRVEEALRRAIENPLIEVDIRGAKGAILHLSSAKIKMSEMTRALDLLAAELAEDATLCPGFRIDPELGNTLKVVLVVTGVRSPHMLGPTEEKKHIKLIARDKDLGIEFI